MPPKRATVTQPRAAADAAASNTPAIAAVDAAAARAAKKNKTRRARKRIEESYLLVNYSRPRQLILNHMTACYALCSAFSLEHSSLTQPVQCCVVCSLLRDEAVPSGQEHVEESHVRHG